MISNRLRNLGITTCIDGDSSNAAGNQAAVRCSVRKFLGKLAYVFLLSTLAWSGVGAQNDAASLQGQVVDEDGHPVARVEVTARWGVNSTLTVFTDAAGKFQIPQLPAGRIQLSLSKADFFRIENSPVDLKPGANDSSFTLNHETEIQQKVEVRSDPAQIDPATTSHQETLVEHDIVNTPVPASHDLQQSLITIPNVVQDQSGAIHVAGARQGQTEILLDGFEINDPANGTFTPRLNVDAVQAATVESGGYGAQYAHAGAGVLTLDTKTGDDKWRFGTTNFIPGFSLQDGVHFGNWFPRVTFSGPIKKGRAWFSGAVSAQHSFDVVPQLPSGQNISTLWSGDSLLRMQVKITPRNILQASFLYNRLSAPETGLGPFTPLPTTTDSESGRYFVSAKDQIWMGRTLVSIGAAVDEGWNNLTPQGNATYVVTPDTASGNYFQTSMEHAHRLQFVGDVMTDTYHLWGSHTFSAGWNADSLTLFQQAARGQIDYEREDGTLADQATFFGPNAFHLSNTQLGAYAQDQWRPTHQLIFSAGVRADWDRLAGHILGEPRLAMNWVPIGDGRMKFTVAWGEHYQPLNLSIVGQALDQQRMDVFYDSTGTTPVGNPEITTFTLPAGHLGQARSQNTNLEWNAKIFQRTYVGAAFLFRDGRDGYAWELESTGTFLLQNDREDRYIAGEVWVKHSFGNDREIAVDYTRSHATSSQVLDPTLASLVFNSQESGPEVWDAPNRLISHGWTPLPWWKLLVSYFFDWHSGFPYSAITDQQQLFGVANSFRYPNYLSLNIGLEKQFYFHKHEWAVRVSSDNITGHNNPDVVVNNVDAPNFGTFSGTAGRAFTVRIRLITQN